MMWESSIESSKSDHANHQCQTTVPIPTLSRNSISDVCGECGAVIVASPRAAPKGVDKAQKSRIKQRARQPRKTPAMLRHKLARTQIKAVMLANVPGVTFKKAEAILTTFEDSMAQLIGASSTRIAKVMCANGKPLGEELGVAVFRALH